MGGGWTLLSLGGGATCNSAQKVKSMLSSTKCSYLEVERVNALAKQASDVRLQVGATSSAFGAWTSTAKSVNSKAIEALQSKSSTWHNGAKFDNWDWTVACPAGAVLPTGWPNMYTSTCNSGGVAWMLYFGDCNQVFHDMGGGCSGVKSKISATWLR